MAPTFAFADYAHVSTGGSGASSFAGSGRNYDRVDALNYHWYWYDFNYESTDIIADIVSESNVEDVDSIYRATKGKYLTNDEIWKNYGGYPEMFIPFASSGGRMGVTHMFNVNFTDTTNRLPGEWCEEAEKKGFSWRQGTYVGQNGGTYDALWWFNGSEEPMDAIWLSTFERIIETEQTVLDYHADKDHETTPYLDNRNCEGSEAGRAFLYDCGITESNYDYHTKALQKSDSNIEKARAVTIKRVEHQTCHYGDHGEIVVESRWFEHILVGSSNFKKTFIYQTKLPTINQEYYRPFNLNRNGYATTEDVYYFGNESNLGLEGTVDNKQGITDNSPLNALDINNDTPFSLKFNNYSFGLRSDYNWDNTPALLACGNYENVWSEGSGPYANGKNDPADPDGRLRYYLNFYASISNNRENPAIDSASLKHEGKELTASQEFHKTMADKWSGGDFVARFTYIDGYNTDNHTLINDPFYNWWMTSYHEARFYEYGTHYKGKATVAGIMPPTWCLNKVVQDKPVVFIMCDANDNARGLYIDMKERFFEQPIMYGKWDVKTVAGSVN